MHYSLAYKSLQHVGVSNDYRLIILICTIAAKARSGRLQVPPLCRLITVLEISFALLSTVRTFLFPNHGR